MANRSKWAITEVLQMGKRKNQITKRYTGAKPSEQGFYVHGVINYYTTHRAIAFGSGNSQLHFETAFWLDA